MGIPRIKGPQFPGVCVRRNTLGELRPTPHFLDMSKLAADGSGGGVVAAAAGWVACLGCC